MDACGAKRSRAEFPLLFVAAYCRNTTEGKI
jgi:hypothetical protein